MVWKILIYSVRHRGQYSTRDFQEVKWKFTSELFSSCSPLVQGHPLRVNSLALPGLCMRHNDWVVPTNISHSRRQGQKQEVCHPAEAQWGQTILKGYLTQNKWGGRRWELSFGWWWCGEEMGSGQICGLNTSCLVKIDIRIKISMFLQWNTPLNSHPLASVMLSPFHSPALIPSHTATHFVGVTVYHLKKEIDEWRFNTLQTSLFHLRCLLCVIYLIDCTGKQRW